MDLLTALGTAVWISGALALIARRIRGYQYDGLLSIAEGLFCLDALRTGDHLLAVFAAAMCAYFAHRWWRGGGGRRYSPPSSFPAPQVLRGAPYRPATHSLTPASAF